MPSVSDIKTAVLGGGKPVDKPILAGEVHALWNFLTLRYLYLEMTDIFKNYIKDIDFKQLASRSVSATLNKQIQTVEALLKDYGLAIPPKPPFGINTAVNAEAMRDEMMYRLILVGVQYFIETHAETLRMMSSDGLRNLFMGWMKEELTIFDDLVKYGKIKGWYWGAPAYQH
ncbi:MAG: DUF3231 family protein [Bacillota bacterium]